MSEEAGAESKAAAVAVAAVSSAAAEPSAPSTLHSAWRRQQSELGLDLDAQGSGSGADHSAAIEELVRVATALVANEAGGGAVTGLAADALAAAAVAMSDCVQIEVMRIRLAQCLERSRDGSSADNTVPKATDMWTRLQRSCASVPAAWLDCDTNEAESAFAPAAFEVLLMACYAGHGQLMSLETRASTRQHRRGHRDTRCRQQRRNGGRARCHVSSRPTLFARCRYGRRGRGLAGSYARHHCGSSRRSSLVHGPPRFAVAQQTSSDDGVDERAADVSDEAVAQQVCLLGCGSS